MTYPEDIRIQLTTRCNLYCQHCFASANDKKASDELTDSEFLNLFEQIICPDVKAISLTGGEPLLRGNLVIDMLSLIQDTRIVKTLNTNGWFLTKSFASNLKEGGLDRVQVSLDSSIPGKHDIFRKKSGSYERALNAIENCSDAGIETHARVTITSFNFNELPDILHLVLGRGGNGVIVKPLVPSGRGQGQIKHPSHVQHIFAVKSLLDSINSETNVTRNHVQFLTPSYPFLIDSEFTEYNDHCDCGDKLAFISSTGNVQPCGYTHYVLGNLKEESLESIWTNAPFLIDWRAKRLNGKCQSCEFVDICEGGCRAAAYETSGKLDTTDPLCWR